MEVWTGSLNLPNDEGALEDLHLNLSEKDAPYPSINGGSVDFLGFVDPSRIPLQLIAGPNLEFISNNEESLEWFRDVLVNENLSGLGKDPKESNQAQHLPWQEAGQLESNVAVLAKVMSPPTASTRLKAGTEHSLLTKPRVTELLFYASLGREAFSGQLPTPPTSSSCPELGDAVDFEHEKQILTRAYVPRIFAIPLSSDLLYQPSFHDLGSLPIDEARFVKSFDRPQKRNEVSKKRDRLGSVFDEASSRRKRARHKGGQSISLAASRSNDATISQFRPLDGKHIKAEDVTETLPPLTTDIASPSLGSDPKFSRSLDTRETLKSTSRRGTLTQTSRSASANIATSGSFEDTSMEAKNKQMISRIVMTAMRIYGLEQRKSTVSFGKQKTTCPEESTGMSSDTEYKGIYHQAYKGALFAFRRNATTETLQAEAVRDVVDRLLDIFCRQPP